MKKGDWKGILIFGVCIIVVIFVAIVFYVSPGVDRSKSVRGPAMNVKTVLDLARQRAITYGEATRVAFAQTPTNACMTVFVGSNKTGSTHSLAEGVRFQEPVHPGVVFSPDGLTTDGDHSIVLVTDARRDVLCTITLDGATGRSQIQRKR